MNMAGATNRALVQSCAASSQPGAWPALEDALFQKAGRVRVFEPGRPLFLQGDECSGIFIIRSGVVGLRRLDQNGNSALVSLVQQRDLVGHEAFLSGEAHAMGAEALTICQASYVETSCLNWLLEKDSHLEDLLVQSALADLKKSQIRCAGLLTENLKVRLLNLFMQLRVAQGGCDADPLVIDLPIQRKDVAALIGAAPESLSRLLRALENEGAIRIEGRRVDFTAAARLLQGHSGELLAVPSRREAVIASLMQARQALLSMLDASNTATRMALNERVQSASARLDALLALLIPVEPLPATRFKEVWEQFKQTRQTDIIPAIFAGRMEQARRTAFGIQAERVSAMRRILSPVT